MRRGPSASAASTPRFGLRCEIGPASSSRSITSAFALPLPRFAPSPSDSVCRVRRALFPPRADASPASSSSSSSSSSLTFCCFFLPPFSSSLPFFSAPFCLPSSLAFLAMRASLACRVARSLASRASSSASIWYTSTSFSRSRSSSGLPPSLVFAVSAAELNSGRTRLIASRSASGSLYRLATARGVSAFCGLGSRSASSCLRICSRVPARRVERAQIVG